MNALKIAILRELRRADETGAAYPAAALRNAVRWAVVPQPTYAEIDAALDDLQERKHVTAVQNELCGLRFFVTDAGRAALANL